MSQAYSVLRARVNPSAATAVDEIHHVARVQASSRTAGGSALLRPRDLLLAIDNTGASERTACGVPDGSHSGVGPALECIG
jgi:hypothetical protein